MTKTRVVLLGRNMSFEVKPQVCFEVEKIIGVSNDYQRKNFKYVTVSNILYFHYMQL